MKIALLGKGKTGSKVIELNSGELEVFDRTNLPTRERLENFDVIISFLPGEVFLELIPMLIETKRPVVTGSTGFKWPDNFSKKLSEKKLKWIYASNFSIGVVVLKQLIEKLHSVEHLFENKSFAIHEIHHKQKLDAPSGTALSMKEWLNKDCDITSERTADVVGFHSLKMETKGEIIRLEHEAKDRSLFAEGALWAANYILHKNMEPGLHAFQKVVENHLSL
jgi:4-hydroxy-tetrahydrodipicolinate reductase